MLTEIQRQKIIGIVNYSLDVAEEHWNNGGPQLITKSSILLDHASDARFEVEPSKIPGHALVQEDKTIIDEFIAFVADMRGSSTHLSCAISEKISKVTGLQRVYFETSALLPAIAQTVKYEEGSVTEYLGDGILALYQVDPKDRSRAIYAAHRAAKNAISDTRDLVNFALNKRYSLPPLDIGVGLAISKSLVTLVGLDGEKHPKAIGECIYRATKLSGGKNQVLIDEFIKMHWPSAKGGKISFMLKKSKGFDGYLAHSE